MKKLILIDGSGLIYRGFYAIPPFLKAPDGTQTNAVFGFTNILISLLANQKPDYLAVALDKKGPTFRHKEYKEYKATRIKAPQELYDQIPLVKTVIETFSIPLFENEGYEADDILATIVKKTSNEKNLQIFIATGDFDVFQVIGPKVFILYPSKGFKEADILRTEDIRAKYGFSPEQIPDYKGLAGDSSDNIPGVFGIGNKGATELIQKYKNLENIYKHLDEIKGSLHQKLVEGKTSALMSKWLATLDSNTPVDFDLALCRVKNFNAEAVRKLFEKLGFKSLQKRLDELFSVHYSQNTLF
ncbi:hypothetical protein HZC21_02620 [Candidatus Peregrinibacteria bacterium]|nr:hypothetical protein [Candidatus Peregrinibacteria bacterium]